MTRAGIDSLHALRHSAAQSRFWRHPGTFGYGIEFANILDLNELGGLVTKGLSREPIAGNPAPRLWHTEGGMMNSVGLQNVGVRAFVARQAAQAAALFACQCLPMSSATPSTIMWKLCARSKTPKALPATS